MDRPTAKSGNWFELFSLPFYAAPPQPQLKSAAARSPTSSYPIFRVSRLLLPFLPSAIINWPAGQFTVRRSIRAVKDFHLKRRINERKRNAVRTSNACMMCIVGEASRGCSGDYCGFCEGIGREGDELAPRRALIGSSERTQTDGRTDGVTPPPNFVFLGTAAARAQREFWQMLRAASIFISSPERRARRTKEPIPHPSPPVSQSGRRRPSSSAGARRVFNMPYFGASEGTVPAKGVAAATATAAALAMAIGSRNFELRNGREWGARAAVAAAAAATRMKRRSAS